MTAVPQQPFRPMDPGPGLPAGLPAGSPAGVLDEACAAIVPLGGVLWAARRPEELVAAKRSLELLRSRLAAVDAVLCREIEATGAARREGWASAADYLTAITGGRRGSGRRWLRTAKALTADHRPTLAALWRGDVSAEQATAIVDAVDGLPVKASLRRRGERALLKEAARCDATELNKTGRHLIDIVDPDREDARDERALDREDRAAHLSRHLSIAEDGIGGVRIRGRGTVEDAAVIKSALLPLTTPDPKPAMPAAGPDGPDGPDPGEARDHGARLWDALVAGCQRLLDTEVLPDGHGAKPRMIVATTLADLQKPDGSGWLDTGEELTAGTLRRLACDADLIPAVLDTASVPLDLGRSHRLVAFTLWMALIARDRHCAFPGCRRPPIMCHAHHIRHWADGGPTSLDNLVLLCGTHHRLIHDTPWQVRLSREDRRPEFLPPPTRRRERRWIRHREARAPDPGST